jgi:DNA-binding CsgD family transcriptional regulator
MSGLSERDLHRLLGVVEDGRRDAPTAGLPWVVLERLAEVIRCDDLSWNDLDVDGEYFASNGVTDCLFVGLPAQAGHARRLLCWRSGGRGFSARDALVLELLRPHLVELVRDSELRLSGVPRLSRREWEVLRLAAEGNSNADIARILVVSVGTVRKHMEHVFDRTGVRTRSAAVAKMMPRLLAGPPGP